MSARINWAQRLIQRFSDSRILVLGDVMLDRYIYGSVERISPEAPVPVVRVTREEYFPGGGANVARNIRALGGCAFLAGLIGQDQNARDLLAVLKREGVETSNVVRVPGLHTIVKMRVMAERQQVVRVDWDELIGLSPARRARFCRQLAAVVENMAGVVIEDYAKGTVDQDVLNVVLDGARRRGIPVALDPKENAELDLTGLTVATPNRREAFALAQVSDRASVENPLRDKPLLRVAGILMDKWRPSFLVITLGAQGMLLVSPCCGIKHVPTAAREVFDVSGAGDTVIATVILALASGASHTEAAELANCAAGVVIGKVGTATCTGDELLGFLRLLVKQGIDKVRARS